MVLTNRSFFIGRVPAQTSARSTIVYNHFWRLKTMYKTMASTRMVSKEA